MFLGKPTVSRKSIGLLSNKSDIHSVFILLNNFYFVLCLFATLRIVSIIFAFSLNTYLSFVHIQYFMFYKIARIFRVKYFPTVINNNLLKT